MGEHAVERARHLGKVERLHEQPRVADLAIGHEAAELLLERASPVCLLLLVRAERAQLALGIDDRPVVAEREAKSCGTENTFAKDLTDREAIAGHLEKMAAEVARWLGRHRLFARTVTIKVRYSDFTTVTRSHSASRPTRDADEIARRAITLLDRTDARLRAVRLLGASVHNLIDPAAPSREPLLPFERAADG